MVDNWRVCRNFRSELCKSTLTPWARETGVFEKVHTFGPVLEKMFLVVIVVILHKTPAPFHPSMNGQAENTVKTYKVGILKMLKD